MMNKLLHPTMQAIKAAASEGDLAKLESYRATFDPQRAAAYSNLHVSFASSMEAVRESLAEPTDGVDPEEDS
jgi:hypothetical protein